VVTYRSKPPKPPERVDAKYSAAVDPRKSRIVELRFFGGLTLEETAEVLSVSSRTVIREWDLAKAWLNRELSVEKAT
jgi:DNA-directed RNA polymerase specialized sigma subunit